MRKTILIPLLLLSAFLLAACRGAATEEPTPVPADTAAPPPVQTQSSPQPAAPGAMAACTVVSQDEGPNIEEYFPAVSDADWVKGPADARVTIIEYSDFQ
jgi:protein-disulfide isomerase